MHAYCRISAVGSRRSRARAPREMDQPPALKTRRSNAVQTRRLALHVSLLQRHLAVLEAERARDIRVLQEELNHLQHVPCKHLRMASPHLASSGGSAEKGEERLKPLPKLERSSPAEDCIGVSLSRDQPLVTDTGLPPISVQHDRMSNDEADKYVTSQLKEGISHQNDSSPSLERCCRGSVASSCSTKPGAGRKGRVCLSTSEGGRFLPPTDQNRNPLQGQGNAQNQTHADSEEGALERNVHSLRRGETERTPGHFEEPGESESTVTHPRVKGEQPAGTLPPQHSEHTPEIHSQSKGRSSPLPRKVEPLSEPATTRHRARTPTFLTTTRSTSHVHNLKTRCHLAGDRNGDKCNHFPCTRPPTYHSLGFHPDLSTHTWRHWLHQNACRPHHRLLPGRPTPKDSKAGEEKRDPVRKRRGLGKEEVIRLDMARKKQLHALARPPSWNTNYGQPTPYKRLKNPARLKPLL